ncbi:DUF2637 domain-containing protein [Streptomyces sp. NPDC056817]|uniref:DUF2637 domain-containing protein n=1 Tax=Streptomyces sp. NPDC056817 TaxID=3345950 RepID=UPI0036D02CA9
MPDPYRTAPAPTGRTRTTRVLVTGVFLVAVAAFESVGFRLSYEALHRVAVDNAVPEHSAWMFPVLVDGGIVLGSIGVVRALAGRRSTRPYWFVTIGFTLVSWGFNVSNAPKTAGGWAVATVAPLAQMVALEMGMQELRALLLQQSGTAAPAAAPEAAPAPAAAPEVAPAPEAAPAPAAPPAPEAAPTAAAQAAAAAPETAPAPEAAPEKAAAAADDSTTQHADDAEQQHTEPEQQEQQQETAADDSAQQRPQRQRPPLQPDTSSPWAVLYEKCSTEEQRVALTREALTGRSKLTAPQWSVDIGKGETRARDLLRAARKPPACDEPQAQLELLSA